MTFEKQSQKAGENSQQFQVETVIINNGVDEKRAREIVDEKLQAVIKGYSQEAQEVAENRINQFVDDLIPKLVKEELLDALKDPSVQILLMEAQKSAASTERPTDYILLSELLLHRVVKGENRNVRAGVSHAIKIVDEITDEALLALTVAYSISQWIPVSGSIDQGLHTLDTLFGKIMYAVLPTGSEWIEHLDVLDAVRINPFASLKKTDKFYAKQLDGYVEIGIDKTSENYKKALEIIKNANLPDDILCDHELRTGFVRLHMVSINEIDKITITHYQRINVNGIEVALPIEAQLTDIQKEAIHSIYSLYCKDTNLETENISIFMNKWNEYDNLMKLRIWWDAIPICYTITPVGKVLAHANAQKCDPSLPSLD